MHPFLRRSAFAILSAASLASLFCLRAGNRPATDAPPTPQASTTQAERPQTLETSGAAPILAAPDAVEVSKSARPGSQSSADPAHAAQPVPEQPFTAFNSWARQYLAAQPEARPALIEQGRQLATDRRSALARLINEDPRQALEHAVPMVVRQDLPPEITAHLETRVSAKGALNVYGVVPDPAQEKAGPSILREAVVDGRSYNAHVFGKRLAQRTSENAHFSGIALGKELALDERPLRVLEAGERPVASSVFTTCPISKKSVPVAAQPDGSLPPVTEKTPAVEIAGAVHYMCSGGHIIQVEEEILAGEGISGGTLKPSAPITSTVSTGVRSLLYMRVTFPDSPTHPQSEAAAYAMMDQVNSFFVENSYGNLQLVTTVAPLIVLPKPMAWYNSAEMYAGTSGLRRDAQDVARSLGYDTNQYDLDIVAYVDGPGAFGGLGSVGGKGAWIKSITAGVIEHELGHNFGLMHANRWIISGTSPIGAGTNEEYGNSYDTMGSAAGGEKQFNANHKAQINWLPARSFVHSVTQSGTYRLFAMDQPRLNADSRYAIKINKDSDREYWAEFRQKSFNGNRWIKDGILLNWSPWAGSTGAQILDMTPQSPDGLNDAALVVGRTFSDFESGIHITPIGKAGTTPEAMDVVVNLGTFPNNHTPVLSTTASATAVGLNAPVTFTASASDPDGDALSYAWDFGDRTFSTNNSPTVTKSWATTGDYVVRCVVSDMKGKTASRSMVVRVGSPSTWRISGTVTFNGAPLANARVGVQYDSARATFTNTDGSFILAGVRTGSVTLEASLDGFTFTPSFTNPLTVGPEFTGANFSASALSQVTLTVTDGDCAEGTANPGKLTLTRSAPLDADLTVRFAPFSGSASVSDYALGVAGSQDYNTASYIIPAGQASLELVLNATADSAAEGPETVRLELLPSFSNDYTLAGPAFATIEIRDANSSLPQVSLRAGEDTATEAGKAGSFVVSRTGPTTSALSVSYTLAGSATNGADYATLAGSVSIPAGASSVTLPLTPINDSTNEGAEEVTLTLATSAAYLRNGSATSATVNLVDDDRATINVTASDPNASEAPGDTGTFFFTRTGSTAQPLTIAYTLTGSAQQGADFMALPGTVTFPAGSAQANLAITPLADGIGEAQQTVVLQIRSSAAYDAGPASQATVTIDDGQERPVISVRATDGSFGEPTNAATVRFYASSTVTTPITVRYTVSGTAANGVDYASLPGTVTIGTAGYADVAITPIDDTLAEDMETVTIAIAPDPAYSSYLDASVTLYLADNEQPAVSVNAARESFSETYTKGTFYFSRTGATDKALTVNYTLGGSAINGVDYGPLPGSVVIPVGARAVSLEVPGLPDTLVEGAETFILSLAPGAYGMGFTTSASSYIVDSNRPTLNAEFVPTSASGPERNGTVSIPVTLASASSTPVSVTFTTYGGTAAPGLDYLATSGTLTFAPGETVKNIALTLLDDQRPEASETVVLKLLYATGASLNYYTTTFTYTITDNDAGPAPTLAFAAGASSGPESQAGVLIPVSLSAPQSGPVSVAYAVSGGTATKASDYSLANGTLTFAPGETIKSIALNVVDDTTVEPDETVTVSLSAPAGASLGTLASHTFTIVNNDDGTVVTPTVTISATDSAASEPGTDTGTFTLTRTGDLSASLTVGLSTSGTATTGADYQALPGSVTFAPGAATAALNVKPLDDQAGEETETVTATLLAGSGYNLGAPGSATVTITDNEPRVSITAADARAAEAGSDPGVFTITRTGSTAASLSVAVELSGTATLNSDYTASTRPVVIPAGAASATLTITPVNDRTTEPEETIVATIASGAYLVSGPASATATLADDDVNSAPVLTLTSPASANVSINASVSLVLVASVQDDGLPATPGQVTTTWSQTSGPGTVTFANPAQPSTTASFSAPGTYAIRLSATDGELSASLDLTVTVTPGNAWLEADIGAPALPGSFVEENGALTIKGNGGNINGSSDQFHFVYQSLTGDGEIKARLTAMSGGGNSAKAGVMLRNSSSASSRAALASYLQPNSTQGSASFRTRATDGGSYSATTNPGNTVLPAWIRIVRQGDNFTGYRSNDGVTWAKVGTTRAIAMDQTILIGFAVSSNNTAYCTAVFDNITITRASAAATAASAPTNQGPEVRVGSSQSLEYPAAALLPGEARDDGLPLPASLSSAWSKVSGPGQVGFGDPAQARTTASFSSAGNYVLRLTANDGQVATCRDLQVTVKAPAPAPMATTSAAPATTSSIAETEGTGPQPVSPATYGSSSTGTSSSIPPNQSIPSIVNPASAPSPAITMASPATNPLLGPVLGVEGPYITLTYQRPLATEGLHFIVEAWSKERGWHPVPASEVILADDGIFRLVKARVLMDPLQPMPLRLHVSRP